MIFCDFVKIEHALTLEIIFSAFFVIASISLLLSNLLLIMIPTSFFVSVGLVGSMIIFSFFSKLFTRPHSKLSVIIFSSICRSISSMSSLWAVEYLIRPVSLSYVSQTGPF